MIRQLLPLKYHSVYEHNGLNKLTTYRMWFGRIFQIKTRTLGIAIHEHADNK